MHNIPLTRDWRDMPIWVVLAMDAPDSEAPRNWRAMFGSVFVYGYGRNQCADVRLDCGVWSVPVSYSVFR